MTTGRIRALRVGEVMGTYMEFDRTADHSWTPAEYLVRFGEFVSQRTADINNEDMNDVPSVQPMMPNT